MSNNVSSCSKKLSVLIVVLFAISPISLFAHDFSAVAPTGQTLYYTITSVNTNVVEVSHPGAGSDWGSVQKPIGSLTIPSTVVHDGVSYSVKSIGLSAFIRCTGLTAVVIPNSVTTIGTSAFNGCGRLTSVNIPNSVTTLASYVFSSCTTLTSIVIPNSVTSIGSEIFGGCTSLTSVSLPETLSYLPYGTFYGCSSLASIVIPNHVTHIGQRAFWQCTNLVSVSFPNALDTLDHQVFYGCTHLASVNLPGSLSWIGTDAFYNCSQLRTVYLKSVVPPGLGVGSPHPFSGTHSTLRIHVPCGSLLEYQSRWSAVASGRFVEEFVYSVRVMSANSNMGIVEINQTPNCTSPQLQVTASPYSGYRFTRWQDGYVINPRTITVTSDTQMVAYFASINDPIDTQSYNCHVNAISSDQSLGTVTGGGSFLIGETCTLTSIIKGGCSFVGWSNGVLDNPYSFVVSRDTVIAALFSRQMHDTIVVRDSTLVPVFDTTFVSVFDTTFVPIFDTTFVSVFDTTFVPVFDTTFVPIFDTTFVSVFDTSYIYDTISIDDILYHNLSVITSNSNRGIVAGNGRFPDSCAVEIAAIPIEGNKFIQWHDGNTENPRTILVTDELSFFATFEARTEGVTNVEKSRYSISTTRNIITLQGAEGMRVRIFDNLGRLLVTEEKVSDIHSFHVSASGTYLVQVGDNPARKVVVIR